MTEVRGLGDGQKADRLLTEGKIASILSVSPMTYQQLWYTTRIHRNILRDRLDSLVRRQVLINHTYSIPYEQRYYGDLQEYYKTYTILGKCDFSYFNMSKYYRMYYPPRYKRNYYLLNWSSTEAKSLLTGYLNTEKIKMSYNTYESTKLSFLISDAEILMYSQSEHRKQLRYFPSNDELLSSAYYELLALIINERITRESNYEMVRNRVKFSIEIKVWVVNPLKAAFSFFRKYGFSMLDILIRCSTDLFIKIGKKFHHGDMEGFYFCPMMHYCLLLELYNEWETGNLDKRIEKKSDYDMILAVFDYKTVEWK